MKRFKVLNGGGGKAPEMAPPPPAPPPPPPEDKGPDPAMQAEIEKQRALRFKAGAEGTTGADQSTTGADEQEQPKTLLGE